MEYILLSSVIITSSHGLLAAQVRETVQDSEARLHRYAERLSPNVNSTLFGSEQLSYKIQGGYLLDHMIITKNLDIVHALFNVIYYYGYYDY